MIDRFGSHSVGTTSPATKVFAVTPNDGADLSETVRVSRVKAAGTTATNIFGLV